MSDRERFAAYRSTQDRAVRDELVAEHAWLARRLARRMAFRGEPLDDLVQVAMIGLLKSVERFDPSYGVEFTSFATPTIVGELRRHFRDRTWRVRVTRRLQELGLAARGATEHLTGQLQRSPTVREIASFLDVREEEVLEALEAATNYRPKALVADADEPEDGTGDRDAVAPGGVDRGIEQIGDLVDARALLAGLPARQRRVVFLTYFCDMTQSEIARDLGVSQVQVSRLLRAAIERLRSIEAAPPGAQAHLRTTAAPPTRSA